MAISKNKEIKVRYSLINEHGANIADFNNSIERIIEKPAILENAYIKVCNINGSKDLINFTVGVYDEAKFNLYKVEQYEFAPDTSDTSENFIKQAYEYLKTTTEYEGAIDVLEEGQSL